MIRLRAGPHIIIVALGLLVTVSIVILLHSGHDRVDVALLAAGQQSDEAWVKLAHVRSRSESRISASDENQAMQTLVASGMTGPGGRSLEKPLNQEEHYEAMRTLVNAGVITSKDIHVADLRRSSHLLEDSPARETVETEQALSPCDLQPDHLDCSEYPSGLFSPEYARAKLGPHVKVIVPSPLWAYEASSSA